jgi:hypothetical protein
VVTHTACGHLVAQSPGVEDTFCVHRAVWTRGAIGSRPRSHEASSGYDSCAFSAPRVSTLKINRYQTFL